MTKRRKNYVEREQFDGLPHGSRRCNSGSRRRGGALSEKINPQDFADRIRALPVRGGVDHEWHIFHDDTHPASLNGGSWECLGEGIFLRGVAESTSIATSSKTTTKDGGSADAVVVKHNHTIVTLLNAGNGVQSEDLTIIYPQGYNSRQISYYNENQPVYAEDTGVDGTGKNNPPYKNCHIWRRIS